MLKRKRKESQQLTPRKPRLLRSIAKGALAGGGLGAGYYGGAGYALSGGDRNTTRDMSILGALSGAYTGALGGAGAYLWNRGNYYKKNKQQ